MKNFSLVILALAVVMSFSAIFVVQEGEKAIVLLFSKVEKDSDDNLEFCAGPDYGQQPGQRCELC